MMTSTTTMTAQRGAPTDSELLLVCLSVVFISPLIVAALTAPPELFAVVVSSVDRRGAEALSWFEHREAEKQAAICWEGGCTPATALLP